MQDAVGGGGPNSILIIDCQRIYLNVSLGKSKDISDIKRGPRFTVEPIDEIHRINPYITGIVFYY